MQRRFIFFRASSLDPSKLESVCCRYYEYEHARFVRSLLIKRLLLVLATVCLLTTGLHALPDAALATTALLACAGAGVAIAGETKARRRLARELRNVPTDGEDRQ
jgi:hypothetical protein